MEIVRRIYGRKDRTNYRKTDSQSGMASRKKKTRNHEDKWLFQLKLRKKEKEKMNLAEKDLKYIWHPCSQMKDYETFPPIVVDHAKGLYLYDKDGKRYADVISSWWCHLLGHCHPRISAGQRPSPSRMWRSE